MELAVRAAGLHAAGFFVQYVHSDPGQSAALWREGCTGILWPAGSLHQLPYADASVEVVVLNVSAPSVRASLAQLAVEISRMLVPSGLLVLEGGARADIEAFPQYPLLQASSSFGNVLVRTAAARAPGLPLCGSSGNCSFPRPGRMDMMRKGDTWCGIEFHPLYVPLTDPGRESKILASSDFEVARFRNTVPQGYFLGEDGPERLKQPRYTGPVGMKSEWEAWCPETENMIKAGKVKSLLDAGAGTCSLYGVLLQRKVFPMLTQYMSFGAYDCAMMRLCGERGTVTFQHDWLFPLPLCPSCQFDLVYQVQGVHHTAQTNVSDMPRVYDTFAAATKCNGWIFICDHKSSRWVPELRLWAAQRGHRIASECLAGASVDRPAYLVQKVC